MGPQKEQSKDLVCKKNEATYMFCYERDLMLSLSDKNKAKTVKSSHLLLQDT